VLTGKNTRADASKRLQEKGTQQPDMSIRGSPAQPLLALNLGSKGGKYNFSFRKRENPVDAVTQTPAKERSISPVIKTSTIKNLRLEEGGDFGLSLLGKKASSKSSRNQREEDTCEQKF